MTRTVVALFALASLAAGCAGILGIQELPETDAGVRTDSGTAGTDASHDAPWEDAGAPDAASDGAPVIPLCAADAGTVTTGELEWARWPMPNSSVDVAGGAPNPESYADNGDGTVTDDVTGLMWQKTAPSADVQAVAIAYCEGLSLAGYDDWHLPTYIELVSIVDLSQQSPSIDLTHFPAAQADIYWASTPAATAPSEGWDVSFVDGHTSRGSTTGIHHARCVRRPGVAAADAGAPCSRYVAGASNTVRDTLTGLTWQSKPSRNSNDTWALSKAYCASGNFGGIPGWRLPTASELLTIVDVTQIGPAVDPSWFPMLPSQSFWSSSPVAGSTTVAWDVNLDPGQRSGTTPVTQGAGVLCVR